MSQPEIVIEAEGLTRYFGEFLAVDHVSFSVQAGEVVGYLGPNGSGKTTTMRMLCGLLTPDSGEGTGNLREREIGNPVAVRDAPSHENAGSIEAVYEFRHEPALSHPRLSEDRDELGAALTFDPRGLESKQRKLVGATDERSCVPDPTCPAGPYGIERVPGLDRDGFTLGGKLDPFAIRDHTVCCLPRSLADQYCARLCVLLQAGSDVHRIPRDDQLPSRSPFPTRDDVAGVDAHAQSNLCPVRLCDTSREGRKGLVNAERRPYRAFRIIFVCLGDSEDGEDRVADELLGDSSVSLDLVVDSSNVPLRDAQHSGSSRSPSAIEPTRSAKSTETTRRSSCSTPTRPPGASLGAAPHVEQNAAAARCSVPHAEQVCQSDAPHA
jgi:energy-coupling factor transporter ATP-binding protein EcfA2